jgi:hypothetical protein
MFLRSIAIICFFVSQLIVCAQASACDPNENCVGFLGIHSPECEARKPVCQHCIAVRATAAGVSIACATAVFTAPPNVSAAICGGSSVVNMVQQLGGC